MNVTLGKHITADNVVDEIWCGLCRDYATGSERTSTFVTGNSVVKKDGVKYHKESASHKACLSRKSAASKKLLGQPTPMQESLLKMDKELLVKMKKLFVTAFYVATNERPFTDFPKLLQLQKVNGLSIGDTYINDKAGKEFVKQIAEVYFDDLKLAMQNSPFISIYSDGSTDRTESEKETILVKLIEASYPVIKFLKLEEPENTKASGILGAVDKAFSDFGIPDYHQKTVGYCSDGAASVMMGSKKGVVKLLKDQYNAPWILGVWCLAHRLELAIKDIFKGTYMDSVIDTLVSVYYFYKGSAKRNKEASTIADIMDEQFLKPDKANGTRWIYHKLRAITKLLMDYRIIMIHMGNYVEDTTNKGEDRAKAKGIINKLRQYKLVWYLHFMKNLLKEVAKVSLLFQREDINTSSAVTKLQSTAVTLNHLKSNPGINQQAFLGALEGDQYKDHTLLNVIDEDVLQRERMRIVQHLIDCLDARFENLHTNPLFLACHVFDHKNWPSSEDQEALLVYGVQDVQNIMTHFAVILQNANGDPEKALEQWTDLKLHVTRNYANFQALHPLAVWQGIDQEDTDRGDYITVIHLTSVFPLSNASCERSFSTMKRVKSDWRCG
ncbi:zinc finger protein 862-like [Argopecten irradians]|uniref:zinc finger protein 862-like n=1 Tax=Argopecten irradians TaxID=31199 RepID=UPI0037111893